MPRLVRTLLGHAQIEMGLLCLGSLLRYSTEPLRLVVHDDGTLSSADRERLAASLGEPRVISRQEADERLDGLLAGHPVSRAFRRENPLGLKLFDTALLAAASELAYCDADVLFRRPFGGLFSLPENAGALFMRDPQNAYSVRSWQLLREPRLRLAARVNSGILTFRTELFDLDLVEWFLRHPQYRFAPVWVEQTAWALLGGRIGSRWLDPARVSFPVPGEENDGTAVALHFISPRRGLLSAFVNAPAREVRESIEARQPVEIRSFEASRLTPLALAMTEARRRLARARTLIADR